MSASAHRMDPTLDRSPSDATAAPAELLAYVVTRLRGGDASSGSYGHR